MGNLIGEAFEQAVWMFLRLSWALIKGLFQVFVALKKDDWNGNGKEEK